MAAVSIMERNKVKVSVVSDSLQPHSLQATIPEWVAVPLNPGIKPRSSTLQVDSLPGELSGKPNLL